MARRMHETLGLVHMIYQWELHLAAHNAQATIRLCVDLT